jgi:deoxyribodipyrimidine photo-lyase
MIHPERVQELNDKNLARGEYVLYWMQQSQRAEYNHALEYAIERGNGLCQPVAVAFGLIDDYPEANLRHYTFMLEGLRETQAALAKRKIEMVVKHGHPVEVALSLRKMPRSSFATAAISGISRSGDIESRRRRAAVLCKSRAT